MSSSAVFLAPIIPIVPDKAVQRTALVLLVLSGVVNYIDRATLAIANPLIREDLNLTVGDKSLLLSAFLWAYACSQLPAGALVDRLGGLISRAGKSEGADRRLRQLWGSSPACSKTLPIVVAPLLRANNGAGSPRDCRTGL